MEWSIRYSRRMESSSGSDAIRLSALPPNPVICERGARTHPLIEGQDEVRTPVAWGRRVFGFGRYLRIVGHPPPLPRVPENPVFQLLNFQFVSEFLKNHDQCHRINKKIAEFWPVSPCKHMNCKFELLQS